MSSLTQADLNQLQAQIDAGDRAGFYILYHNLTGSEQALTQAQVSSYSGSIGQVAFFANAAAKLYLVACSPGERSDPRDWCA